MLDRFGGTMRRPERDQSTRADAQAEFDRLTEQYLADEKAAFDELGFRWFFDFDDADAEGAAASDADAEGAAEADA